MEKNDDILVSVIVPVYNTGMYLQECIESILEQTIPVYEIILVDDNSNDNSASICDKYADNYSNIHVIHKEKNEGLSAARNTGMRVAKGEYLLFCDSDDKLKLEMVEKICKPIEDIKLDIVMCGYETFPRGRMVLPKLPYNCLMKGKDLIQYNKRIHSDNEFCFTWRFLFRRKYLLEKEIWFDENVKIGEDMLFNTKAIMETEHFWVLNHALYMYRIDNMNSIMRTKYKPDLLENLKKQYCEKIKISEEYDLMRDDGWNQDMGCYYITAFRDMLFRNLMNSPEKEKEKKKVLYQILNSNLLTENYKRVGSKIYLGSKRAAIFHFFCKYKFVNIVYYKLKRDYK